MPIYEYACPACGHEFEELVRSADADKIRCPRCQKKAGRKLSVFAAVAAPDRPSSGPPSCQGCQAEPGSCPFK